LIKQQHACVIKALLESSVKGADTGFGVDWRMWPPSRGRRTAPASRFSTLIIDFDPYYLFRR
jgi:hypothetical protein